MLTQVPNRRTQVPKRVNGQVPKGTGPETSGTRYDYLLLLDTTICCCWIRLFAVVRYDYLLSYIATIFCRIMWLFIVEQLTNNATSFCIISAIMQGDYLLWYNASFYCRTIRLLRAIYRDYLLLYMGTYFCMWHIHQPVKYSKRWVQALLSLCLWLCWKMIKTLKKTFNNINEMYWVCWLNACLPNSRLIQCTFFYN